MSNVVDPGTLCMGCMEENRAGGACPACGFDEAQAAIPPHHLPLRTILSGKYLAGRALGEGGFGITYLGWDLNLELKLAIKEYYPTGFVTRESAVTSTITAYAGEGEEFFEKGRERFIEEARRLAKFYTLPGIVSVRDFFLENGTAYIVMEYIDGRTLKSYLAQSGGRLPAAEVLELTKPLMNSLEQVHRAGIIHRDISPDNIMITKEGNLRLLDFGAARDISPQGNKSLSVLLKPGYAPEEQYRSRGKQGPWTDVYALCATMYRAITGVAPEESLERLQEDPVKPPSALGIPMPPQQEAALMRGMAVLQKDRFQGVGELAAALYDPGTPSAGAQQAAAGSAAPKATPAGASTGPGAPPPSRQDGRDGRPAPAPASAAGDKAQGNAKKKRMLAACGAAAGVLVLIFAIAGLSGGGKGGGASSSQKSSSPAASSSSSVREPSASSSSAASEPEWYSSSEAASEALPASAAQPSARGNALGNIINGGLAAREGDWVYYVDMKGDKENGAESGIYKTRADGTGQPELLLDVLAEDLNVVDGWLYYEYAGIERMKTDGSGRQDLVEESADMVQVVDGWIYYVDFNQNHALYKRRTDSSYSDDGEEKHTLYRVKLDGTGRQVICDDEIDAYGVDDAGEWVYYTNEAEGQQLYKIRTDGTGRALLCADKCGGVNLKDGWVYYADEGHMFRPCRVRTDGTGREVISEEASCGTFLNLAGEWIYYWEIDDKSLSKMRIDGTGREKLCEDNPASISVVGDWVYYKNGADDYKIYRVRTDGSGRQKVGPGMGAAGAAAASGKASVSTADTGTTSANIRNGGHVAYRTGDEWIYYHSYANEGRLYKVRTDGTQNTPLNDVQSWYINLAGDWVYYHSGDGDNMRRVRTDGTGDEAVTKVKTWYASLYDGCLYFASEADGASGPRYLYKQETDGASPVLLAKADVTNLGVRGDWVYYIDGSDGGTIHRVKTDGTRQEKITEESAGSMNLASSYIYYLHEDAVHRIDYEGDNLKVLPHPDAHYQLQVLEEDGETWIFWCDSDSVLWKAKEDGTGLKLMAQGVSVPELHGGFVYYLNDGLCRISYDGEIHQKIN